MDWNNAKEYSPAIVRIGLSLVFLWFSINQFFLPNDFTSLIPEFLVNATGWSPFVFVLGNAILEFVLGMFLLLGMHVRLSSFILGIHLLGISLSLGYGPIMIRDLGLTIVTLAIFFQGRDKLCLEKEY